MKAGICTWSLHLAVRESAAVAQHWLSLTLTHVVTDLTQVTLCWFAKSREGATKQSGDRAWTGAQPQYVVSRLRTSLIPPSQQQPWLLCSAEKPSDHTSKLPIYSSSRVITCGLPLMVILHTFKEKSFNDWINYAQEVSIFLILMSCSPSCHPNSKWAQTELQLFTVIKAWTQLTDPHWSELNPPDLWERSKEHEWQKNKKHPDHFH